MEHKSNSHSTELENDSKLPLVNSFLGFWQELITHFDCKTNLYIFDHRGPLEFKGCVSEHWPGV